MGELVKTMCPWTNSCLPLCLLGDGFWVIFVQPRDVSTWSHVQIQCETGGSLKQPQLTWVPRTQVTVFRIQKVSLSSFFVSCIITHKKLFCFSFLLWTTFSIIFRGVDEFRRNFFLLAILEEIVSCPLLQARGKLHTSVDHVFGFLFILASSRHLENSKQIIAGLGYLNHQNQRTSSHQKPNTLFCYI